MTGKTFLIRADGSGSVAHIQAGEDTACKALLGGSTKPADWIEAVDAPRWCQSLRDMRIRAFCGFYGSPGSHASGRSPGPWEA